MIDFFVYLFIGVFWIWGINCLFSYGYIFEPIGMILERLIGSWACKPIFHCPPCMSSLHGTAIFFIFVDLHWHYSFLFVVCLTGINFIIKEYLYPEEQ